MLYCLWYAFFLRTFFLFSGKASCFLVTSMKTTLLKMYWFFYSLIWLVSSEKVLFSLSLMANHYCLFNQLTDLSDFWLPIWLTLLIIVGCLFLFHSYVVALKKELLSKRVIDWDNWINGRIPDLLHDLDWWVQGINTRKDWFQVAIDLLQEGTTILRTGIKVNQMIM